MVGYDPSLYDASNHTYDELGFSISVNHVDVTNVDLYSQLTINGTAQPQILGELSDKIGGASGFFAKTFEDVKKIVNKGNVSDVFELINVGYESLNGLFGGGGGYDITLKGDISTLGTLSLPRYDGTIDLYVKQKSSNSLPNYNPLNNIQYGLLNLKQLNNILVHKNYISNGGCSTALGQSIGCPQYRAGGIDIAPILNPVTGLKYQGASASYFNDHAFHLQPAYSINGGCPVGLFTPDQLPFKCLSYYKTRAGIQNQNWSESYTDDVFNTIGINFTFYHPGYGTPALNPTDPNPVIVYKEFKLGRTFVDGGRIAEIQEADNGSLPYPNPFSHNISIPLQLKYLNQAYDVKIFSLEGKQIWGTQNLAISTNTVIVWDGHSDNGFSAPDGVYVCRISQNGLIINTHKIILQRQ